MCQGLIRRLRCMARVQELRVYGFRGSGFRVQGFGFRGLRMSFYFQSLRLGCMVQTLLLCTLFII